MKHPAQSIEIDLAEKLEDPEFRKVFLAAEDSANIAEQLIALRKRRGLNQSQVAELAGTGQSAISRAERADYESRSYKALKAITDALGGRLRVIIKAWEDVAAEYAHTGSGETEAESVDARQSEGAQYTTSPPINKIDVKPPASGYGVRVN